MLSDSSPEPFDQGSVLTLWPVSRVSMPNSVCGFTSSTAHRDLQCLLIVFPIVERRGVAVSRKLFCVWGWKFSETTFIMLRRLTSFAKPDM
jgi:hypothetical protein